MSFIDEQAAAWSEIRERFSVNETPNGPGSFLKHTEHVRAELPDLLAKYGIASMLDVPCGTWNWLRHVELPENLTYTGWDIEEEFVVSNQAEFGHRFECVNVLTVDRVPTVDLILCRDFLIHLPNEAALEVLEKFRASGSRYLLSTTHPRFVNDRPCPPEGHDDRPGYWCHPINLEAEPFNLTGRTAAIKESDQKRELVLFDLHN
ncbi:methyltransferase [Mycobacterium phage Ariel]|uniref:methyltransferase n=1 Tax=Mycobacterium phage Ariel TaxID=1541824 RepID=UPI0004F8BF2F|nr:methyltransferase [Mycobacterium phage Ariel]AIM49894.1 methyltransferase [Mycobacterium phage Ariel]